jgi:hypothetical protein
MQSILSILITLNHQSSIAKQHIHFYLPASERQKLGLPWASMIEPFHRFRPLPPDALL